MWMRIRFGLINICPTSCLDDVHSNGRNNSSNARRRTRFSDWVKT